MSFEILTKHILRGNDLNKTFVHFLCGCISGGIATAASMPFDTIRTRLVGQGEPKVYKVILKYLFYLLTLTGIVLL
jgi:hypothetical protein